MTRVAALLTCAALLRRPQGGDEATILKRHRLSKLAPAFQPAEDEEGHYIHLGCLVDKIGDRVPGMELIRDDMTTELCYEYCNAQESLYMATQYGNECFCGRDGDPDYSRHRPGICDQPCAGDESERCGSYYSFDLYEIVWPDASTHQEYMNCYADSPEERLMSDKFISDDMTTVLCRNHCKDKGALYYATQFGKECWCGLSGVFEDYERHGPGTCHMRCVGDQSEACGGWHSLSLYRFNEDSPEPAVSTSGSPVESSSEPNAGPVSKPTPRMIPSDGIAYTGDGTHYRETSTCNIPSPIPSMYDGMIPVALGKSQNEGLEECGACIEGERSDNASNDYLVTASFKAYVIDKCSECSHGDLSFIESGDGSWNISWRFVPCPGGSDKPASIIEGSHEYD